MKNYKIKKTNELIKKLKPFWLDFEKINEKFNKELARIEEEIRLSTGLNAEFFYCDNECVGIGNYERTMELIRREELL